MIVPNVRAIIDTGSQRSYILKQTKWWVTNKSHTVNN